MGGKCGCRMALQRKCTFDLPDGVDVKSELRLSDPPTEHNGQRIVDTSIANLGKLYIQTLGQIVDEFEVRFS